MIDEPQLYRYRKLPQVAAFLVVLVAIAAMAIVYLKPANSEAPDVSARSHRQKLALLGATDAYEMFPLGQMGSRFDKAGHHLVPAMTVYLRSPERRRPQTGDVLEIMYPPELAGQVRFTQSKSNGYGGSGHLEWIGKKRNVELGLAIFDSTRSGSLQYRNGNVLLWGDCEKSGDLRD